MIVTPEDVSTNGLMLVKADGEVVDKVVKWDSDNKEIHYFTTNPDYEIKSLKPESAQLIKISDGSIIDSWSK